jgi:hypothetical protein
MKKLPDRPGDVKVDAVHAATLVAARSVSSMAWKHEGSAQTPPDSHASRCGSDQRSGIETTAKFRPVIPRCSRGRSLSSTGRGDHAARRTRQRRPVAAERRIADRLSHRTGRDARSRGSGAARISHGCQVRPPAFTYLIVMPRLCRPRPRTHSTLHRCDDLSLKKQPPLQTL